MAYTAYADILSADILSGILSDMFWHSIWQSFWHLFWHSIWYSDILSGMYSEILSGILSDICSDIQSGNLSGIYSVIPRHTACGTRHIEFGSRRCPLHPELAIWFGSIAAHRHEARRAGRGVDEGKEKEGVAPLELVTLTRHMGKIWDKSDNHTDKHIFQVRGSTTNHHPNPGRKDTTPFKIYTTMAKRPHQRAVSSFVNEIPPTSPGLSIGSILILCHLGDKHRISH